MEEAITNSVKELGYIQLKDEQYKIVKSFLSGNDVFGVLPTGYGNSPSTQVSFQEFINVDVETF